MGWKREIKKSEKDILTDILHDISDIQTTVETGQLDGTSRLLSKIRANTAGLLEVKELYGLSEEELLAKHRAEALRTLDLLGEGIEDCSSDRTDTKLHKMMLVADMFIQRAHTYFEKKIDTERLSEDESN